MLDGKYEKNIQNNLYDISEYPVNSPRSKELKKENEKTEKIRSQFAKDMEKTVQKAFDTREPCLDN